MAIVSTVMISSFIILRLDNVDIMAVKLLTLVLIILCPLMIFCFLILPRAFPKVLLYLVFLLCLGLSYFIIPSSQKDFLNGILGWLLPVVQISIILFITYSLIKGIVRYKEINSEENYTFPEVTRKLLEPKLGKGFFLEAIITEVNVFYYVVLAWFKKGNNKRK